MDTDLDIFHSVLGFGRWAWSAVLSGGGFSMFILGPEGEDSIVWITDDGTVHAVEWVFDHEHMTRSELRALLDLEQGQPLEICYHD